MNQKYQLYNFLLHLLQDTEYTPKWNYQKEPFLETEGLHDLPFRPASLSGFSKEALNQLFNAFAENEGWNLHGMLVSHQGKCIFEKYVPPYRKQYRHVSYSMCKSVVGMAAGLAIDDRKLSLDTKVISLFPNELPQKKSKELKELNIYHLLTMEAGVEFHELSQAFSSDWLKNYLHADFAFCPGGDFYYNSLNSYILCAAIQRVYGCSVMELLKTRIFAPLNIYDITWDTSPQGIVKGGFGMKLSLHDMAKLGLLYMNRGIWYGKSKKKAQRLLSEEYVDAAVKKQTDTGNNGFAYGFHCWVMEDGFLFNGMLGQNVYVFPERELILATQCGSECFLPTEEMMALVRQFIYQNKIESKNNSGGTIRKSVGKGDKERGKSEREAYSAFMDSYICKTYLLEEAIPSVMPFFMQLFYQQVTPGIRRISFYQKQEHRLSEKNGREFYICFSENQEAAFAGENDVTLRASLINPVEQHIKLKGQYYPICVNCSLLSGTDCEWEKKEGGYELSLRIDFLEEANSRIIKFGFSGPRMHIKAFESPSLEYLCGSILSGEVFARSMPKMPKKVPVTVRQRLFKLIRPETYGYEA